MFTTARKPVLVFRITLAFVLIIVFSLKAMTPADAAGITAYVAPSGLTIGSCASWANACDLQHALHIAAPGYSLWVKGGTYYPTSSTDRTISFILKNGVALYGGFAGNENLLAERDPSTNITVLSGDIGLVNNKSDNSYHVVVGGGANNTAILDGFRIQEGNADGSNPDNLGGGMYNYASSPTLTDVAFNDNSAAIRGGGMYNLNSNPMLTNVTFSGNSSNYAGGMYNNSSSPTLTNVTFSGNSADFAGGMFNIYSGPILTDVIFGNNLASNRGGGMSNDSSNPTLTGVSFSNNSATNIGGGMYNLESNPTLTNVIFSSNSADYAGGMYNNSSSPTLTNVTFSGNSADFNGGGMFSLSGSPILTNVTFSGNSANGFGGGMYNNSSSPTLTGVTFNNNSASNTGGGMVNNSSSPTLTDVTFNNNWADVLGGGMVNNSSSPTLTNVTFHGNASDVAGGIYNSLSGPMLTGVTFSGNSANNYGGGMYNGDSNPTLTNVTFSGNSAPNGGGMYNGYSSPTLHDVTFSGNFATSGGGMFNLSSSPTLTGVTFKGNSADVDGGGMANDTSNPTLTDVTFSANSATYSGGGMFSLSGSPILTNVTFSGNSAAGGGGMYNFHSAPMLKSVTFSDNSAAGGGGMYNSLSSPTLSNVILWGNGSEIYNDSSTPTIAYSVVQGSGGSGALWTGLGIDGGGNLDNDPLLGALLNNGGFTETMAIVFGSPAIDAGDDANCPATDQRGVTRPQGSGCDIGAYEYQDLPPSVVSITRADTNPTSAGSVDFTVTFSENVTGVTAGDFVLTTTGVAGTSITNVSGSGAMYTVTVNTGTGNGTIRLDVLDDDSIKDGANNPLGGVGNGNGNFTAGETYTINKTVTATFADVPASHPYFNDIEILYANGYTGGCSTSPMLFCPDLIMNRAQAAVFMVRGNFGSSYVPVTPTHLFGDDWTNVAWAEGWAESMFLTGLSGGCSISPRLFCPEEQLTNVQAAVFGLRMKYGMNYQPPAASGAVFADLTDTSFWGIAWAEKAYTEGLLPACGISGGKPLFCPNNLVSRGFGASIIVKAKDLTMP